MTSIVRRRKNGHLTLWARSGARTEHRDGWEDDFGKDATTAVVAHGLLGNLAVVRGVARLLVQDDGLRAEERNRLLEMLDSQADLMQGILTDLVRGLPPQALDALDQLSQRP